MSPNAGLRNAAHAEVQPGPPGDPSTWCSLSVCRSQRHRKEWGVSSSRRAFCLLPEMSQQSSEEKHVRRERGITTSVPGLRFSPLHWWHRVDENICFLCEFWCLGAFTKPVIKLWQIKEQLAPSAAAPVPRRDWKTCSTVIPDKVIAPPFPFRGDFKVL